VQHKNPESLFLYISVILFPSYHPATNRKTKFMWKPCRRNENRNKNGENRLYYKL